MSIRWGSDPVVRWLRVISAIAFLVLVVIIVLDPARAQDKPLVGLLIGAMLLQLGYEVVVPGITDRRRKPRDEDDA